MKQRKGFTLIELMIVIAIIIILAAIAIPNYLRMTDRARRSRVAGDFVSLATANEAYLVDWGYYPMGSVITGGEFGKVTTTEGQKYVNEITGTTGATHNLLSATTLTGEKGGIDYIKAATVASMYNPFIPINGYFYSCNADGSHWLLYAQIKEGGHYLYRTDMVTDLQETTTSTAPTIS
jgi:prepilin-type N-terminal cleavage/methylation domain-containing protein